MAAILNYGSKSLCYATPPDTTTIVIGIGVFISVMAVVIWLYTK